MKVLQFGRFYRREFGGIERHVALLSEGLKTYATVDNVAAHMDGGTEVVTVPGGKVFAVAAHGLLAGIPIAPTLPFFVRRLCRREQYNIFHLHFPDPLSQFAAGLVNQMPKLVVTWHSDIVRQKELLRAYMPFMKRFLRRADAIVAATPAHFETSTQIPVDINPARLHVIPYGIDPARFALDAAQQAKAVALRDRYAKSTFVFAVGRHVYYKGFEYLIRAMKDVEGTLLLGGSGPLQKELERTAAELGISEKVIFAGRIPDHELPLYYAACDVFCMPSVERSEAFGIVQLEAMAAGRPVVCCELGNGVNYVNRHGETGLAVPPRDPKALARAINTLLADEPLRARMGAAGRARVTGEFSLENMVQGHLRLYRALLAG
jgi:rhamnosyl/mannosyltransferase